MKRRTFLAASAGALALARPSVVRAEKNTMLKFVPIADLGTLDPIWTTSYVTRCHGFMVFDTLYGQAGIEQGFCCEAISLCKGSPHADRVYPDAVRFCSCRGTSGFSVSYYRTDIAAN